MRKRIFFDMVVVILLTSLLLTALSGFLFQSRFSGQIKEELKTLRITLLDETDDVIFDTLGGVLDNHGNRPEVIEAREKGFGERERYSETLGKTTYYYAIQLQNRYIVRLALTADSIYAWLYGLIPLATFSLLVVIALSLALAKRLTDRLIAPIQSIDINNIAELPYQELAPFAKKIETQKNEITSQLETLENRSNTIQAITNSMKEGLLLASENGSILSYSKSISQIFGAEDITGKNILHITRNITFLEKAKQALAGEPSEMIFEQKGRTYTVYFSPAMQDQSVNGAIILFLDTTDKYMAEKQRKEFSANVSHELKTPLTTILALSEMIETGMAKSEDIKDFARKINAQSGRLLSMIDDIIRLSEFDEGSMFKDFASFDIGELARLVVESLDPLAAAKEVTLIAPENSFYLTANKRMIDELIYNLVDNGIQYNRTGGTVSVALEEEKSFVKISVSDTGIGIGEEHHHMIFQRFYRVEKSRSKRVGGTGLGLSIVKHIAEFHGGCVTIQSSEGCGTTISCYLKKD